MAIGNVDVSQFWIFPATATATKIMTILHYLGRCRLVIGGTSLHGQGATPDTTKEPRQEPK